MRVQIKDLPHGTKFKNVGGETVIKWDGLPSPFNSVVFLDEYDDEPRLREVNEESWLDATAFHELKAGDHFEVGGHRFVKTVNDVPNINCVNLVTGAGHVMELDKYVTKIK